MPTENLSSNTEMVSVPRALAERISNICMFTMYKEDWRALSEILAKPAQQRQGEPVAYAVFTDNGNIRIWSTKVMQEEGKQVVPLYAHSAPSATAEVERLRTELDLRTQEREKFIGWCRDARAESTKLRAQLDEAHALRSFANDMISEAYEGGSFDGGDIQDMAVKHGLLRIESRAEECGEACTCREYGFPAECYRKTSMLSASAEPRAPVEIDERASFEYHHRVCDLVRDEDCPEDYRNQSVQDSWEGWQARAALDRKPS